MKTHEPEDQSKVENGQMRSKGESDVNPRQLERTADQEWRDLGSNQGYNTFKQQGMSWF